MDTLSRLDSAIKCFTCIAFLGHDLSHKVIPVIQEQLLQAKDRELGQAQQQLRQQVAIMSDIFAYT